MAISWKTGLPVLIIVFSLSANEIQGQNLTREIHFQLFTRQNPKVPQILELDDVPLLQQSYYNHNLPTKMFAHGLTGYPSAGYAARDGYLQKEDCNFISVDWSVMANGNYNFVGTYYVPLAGELTGSYINLLVSQGTPLDAFHLIGHSFGAHVMGFAGAAVTTGRVARISGLDPSHTDTFFPIDDPDSRLDVSDAQYVDIIHTEGRFTVPIGHVDFFPNGGLIQPGCENATACCAHCRAVNYFDESITTDVGFRAVECSSWEEFQTGSCDNNKNVLMGEYVPPTTQGVFYLATNDVSPFARG